MKSIHHLLMKDMKNNNTTTTKNFIQSSGNDACPWFEVLWRLLDQSPSKAFKKNTII